MLGDFFAKYLSCLRSTPFDVFSIAARKQVEQLQDILQETTAKLMDSQSVATSLKLSSERVVSEMVPKVGYFLFQVFSIFFDALFARNSTCFALWHWRTRSSHTILPGHPCH